MTSPDPASAQHTRELDDAALAFSAISGELLRSYESLAGKAARMEQELCRANAELERKVQELEATHRDLEAILQALPVGVVVRDRDGRVLRVNPALLAILGVEERALLGRGEVPGLMPDGGAGEPREHVRADGARLALATRTSPIEDAQGVATGSVEIVDDRTELVELTERVHRMDKMAALGTMAAGIAHEIRNPMNAIKGFAGLLHRAMEPDGKPQRWAGAIVEGVDEADAIIASMLSFAQPERLALETVEPRAVALDALAAARQRLPGAVEAWTIDVQGEAPSFRGDRIKVRQALRNLVSNAIEAQPDGGRVRVTFALDDAQLVFRVADAGAGVAPADRGRLTDPFFTTRADGTGLGLALVHSIACLHGGSLEVSPEPSDLGGAEFVLRIPFVTSTPSHQRCRSTAY